MVSTVKTTGLALPVKLLIFNFYNDSSIKVILRLNSFFNVFYVPSKLHYKPIPCIKKSSLTAIPYREVQGNTGKTL